METINKMFAASGNFGENIDQMIGYADDQYMNLIGADGASYNAIGGDCGLRPVGVGKKHKAKLAAWEECKKTLADLKLQEKAGDISAKDAEAQANAALARAVAVPDSTSTPGPTGGGSPDPNAPTVTGIGMAGWIGIAVGGAVLIGALIYGISQIGKAKAKQS